MDYFGWENKDFKFVKSIDIGASVNFLLVLEFAWRYAKDFRLLKSPSLPMLYRLCYCWDE